jgi:hypothetical protein
VRLDETKRGAGDGGWWKAIFLEYVNEDYCRVKWPGWGMGFSPEPVVCVDEVRPI